MSGLRTLRTVLLVAGVAVVAGCYRPADVTVYEPGEYKGTDDPLLAKMATEEHKAVLRERLQAVQADR